MPKTKVTWGECLEFTKKTTWQGNGRKSALLYSGKFTDLHSHQFDVTKITARMILEDCIELKNGAYGKPLKHGSLNRYISAVSVVLNHSKTHGLIPFDHPIPKFTKFNPAEDAQERFAYTAEEVQKMHQFARDELMNEALADIILFAALTGIRLDKILSLRPDRVDFDQKLITVVKPKNKNQQARTCGIHDSLLPILVRRCKESRAYLFGDDWTRTSSKAAQNAIRRAFQKCLLHIGKPYPNQGWTFHGLRHTCGTLLYQSGIHIFDIAKQLGHSSTKVTERYMHANDKQLATKINAIDFAVA
jgi:integrase